MISPAGWLVTKAVFTSLHRVHARLALVSHAFLRTGAFGGLPDRRDSRFRRERCSVAVERSDAQWVKRPGSHAGRTSLARSIASSVVVRGSIWRCSRSIAAPSGCPPMARVAVEATRGRRRLSPAR